MYLLKFLDTGDLLLAKDLKELKTMLLNSVFPVSSIEVYKVGEELTITLMVGNEFTPPSTTPLREIPDRAWIDLEGWSEELYDNFCDEVERKGDVVYDRDYHEDIDIGYLRYSEDEREWLAVSEGSVKNFYLPKSSNPIPNQIFEYYGVTV